MNGIYFKILCAMLRLSLILFLFLVIDSHAQNQVLRGRITNSSSHQPVEDVLVRLSENTVYETYSDSLGYFTLSVPYGNYTVEISRMGFRTSKQENVLIAAGKQLVLDLDLTETVSSFDTVMVISRERTGEIAITTDNTQKNAAVFYDPARVVNAHSGLINTDDQSNNISVRGTSPNYIQWKMEGVEIVNPNHLENAGTINDRPALNGGGVSMISAQLLSNSAFKLPPFDAASGNALSGLFDIMLRKGNDEKNERTVQASLLGTDICLEGPFSKKYKASYIVNLRYSTVGMLSMLGVDFGGDRINYKDISYQLAFPTRRGIIKTFGVLGSSDTKFDGKTDSLEVENQKELRNINYISKTLIAGISYLTSLGNNAHFKTIAAYSDKLINRTSAPSSAEWSSITEEKDLYKQAKLSSLSYFSYRVNNSLRFKAGSTINYFVSTLYSMYGRHLYLNGTTRDPLVQPFMSSEAEYKKFEFQIGIHGFYQPRINYFKIQPRALLKYNINEDQWISFNYGINSQVQPASVYLGGNTRARPTSVNSFSLSHFLKVKNNSVKSEVFYQAYNDIPAEVTTGFSAFNYFNGVVPANLVNNGKGKVYGVDLTLSRSFKKFYFSISGSLYNSLYSIDGSTYHLARFNTGYNVVLTTGKEWKLRRGKRFIDVNVRSVIRNGFRTNTFKSDENAFSYNAQLPVYSRTDLRISYRKDRLNSSYIWALDIQNAANQKNVSYYYNDSFTGKKETRYQLGLIPVLSFKVLF